MVATISVHNFQYFKILNFLIWTSIYHHAQTYLILLNNESVIQHTIQHFMSAKNRIVAILLRPSVAKRPALKALGSGVVGCGEGVAYLTSPGCPTDNGLQLGKASYPCSR